MYSSKLKKLILYNCLVCLAFNYSSSQNVIPDSIENCSSLVGSDKCSCFDSKKSSNNVSIRAYSYYYLAQNCNLGLDSSKMFFQIARDNWDSIDYKSFRYLYTYLYPLERHYERSEIDSVNRYFDLLNNVKSDNHPNTLNNIVQANLKKSWTYLKFGDIGTSQMILEDFFVSENYQKLTTEDKIWYLNSYGESLTDINTPE